MYFTPSNIDDLSVEEILNLVEDSELVPIKKAKRAKIIQLIYKMVGYDLSNEALLFHLDQNNRKLVDATAGSGKTSTINIDILINKMLRISENKETAIEGQRMLSLVFNRHNVKQIKDKQDNLVELARAHGIEKVFGRRLSLFIDCYTFHSFCKAWLSKYANYLSMMTSRMINEMQSMPLIEVAKRQMCKKHEIDENNVDPKDLLNVYNFCRESFIEFENVRSIPDFDKYVKAMNKSAEEVEEFFIDVFRGYDIIKNKRKLYDYSDMLWYFYRILRDFEKPRKEIQEFYQYISADEYQDCSPLMSSILELIAGENTPLICIGDADQCIYGFRGADISNTLNFTKTFPNGKVYSLSTNRRCKSNILNSAKYIIEHNSLRFNKNMKPFKNGGTVNLFGYSTMKGQVVKLIKKLKEMEPEQLGKTMICYRERNSSILLSHMLFREDITFHIESGHDPFSYELFKHLFNVLDILYSPYERNTLLKLNKVLPITQQDCYNVLGYDRNKKKFKESEDKPIHFTKLNWGELFSRPKFLEPLTQLENLSKRMDTEPLSSYIDEVYSMLKSYFWNYKLSFYGKDSLPELMEKFVLDYFRKDISYKEFFTKHGREVHRYALDKHNCNGIKLSTFHKLKGLESENVFIIDLDEDIYPKIAEIESRKYSKNLEKSIIESETRLFFVAMTRAKTNLSLFYNERNPSIYIKWLKQGCGDFIQIEPNGNVDSTQQFNLSENNNILNCSTSFIENEKLEYVEETIIEDVCDYEDTITEDDDNYTYSETIEDNSKGTFAIEKNKIDISDELLDTTEESTDIKEESEERPDNPFGSFLNTIIGNL